MSLGHPHCGLSIDILLDQAVDLTLSASQVTQKTPDLADVVVKAGAPAALQKYLVLEESNKEGVLKGIMIIGEGPVRGCISLCNLGIWQPGKAPLPHKHPQHHSKQHSHPAGGLTLVLQTTAASELGRCLLCRCVAPNQSMTHLPTHTCRHHVLVPCSDGQGGGGCGGWGAGHCAHTLT
jgi:hypothetical protein